MFCDVEYNTVITSIYFSAQGMENSLAVWLRGFMVSLVITKDEICIADEMSVVEEACKKFWGGGLKYTAPNINVMIFIAFSVKSFGALVPCPPTLPLMNVCQK